MGSPREVLDGSDWEAPLSPDWAPPLSPVLPNSGTSPIPLRRRRKDMMLAVLAMATVITTIVMSQIFCEDFNKNPGIAVPAALGAGLLGRLAVSALDNSSLRHLGNYLTKFDHPLFQFFSIVQDALPNTARQRQIWLLLIFLQMGYVFSSYILDRVEEPHPTDLEEVRGDEVTQIARPLLLDGDTRGPWLPFLIKGGVLGTAGVTTAVFGRVFENQIAWHLGLVAAGMGPGLATWQFPWRILQDIMKTFGMISPAQRAIVGREPLQQVVAQLLNLAPVLASLTACGLSSALIALRDTNHPYSAGTAAFTVLVGFIASFIDLSRQDEFQYGPQAPLEKQMPLRSRLWKHLKKRPGVYAGVASTLVAAGGLLAANIEFPSPGSIQAATIILAGSCSALGITRLTEMVFPPGERSIPNQINLRVTRVAHLLGLVYAVLLGDFYTGTLTPNERQFARLNYAALLGLVLNDRIRENPLFLSAPTPVYQLESLLTMFGVMTKTL